MIRPEKMQAQISLTPLIDVVFILLIFFMTTMDLNQIKAVDLILPKTVAKSVSDTKKDIITFTITKEGAVYKNKTFADMASLVDFIKDYDKKVIWGIIPNKTISTDIFLKTWKDLHDKGIEINIITPKRQV